MALSAFLDATDVTAICVGNDTPIKRTEALNQKWTGEIVMPSELAPAITEGGTELIIKDGSTEKFVGPCWYGEDVGDEDSAFTTIRGESPDTKFDRRQVMDLDGDYSDPTIIEDNGDAVAIFAAALTNNIANDGSFGLALGSVAAGGVPLIGMRPVDWPMTLQDLRTLLVGTGRLDCVLVPASGGASTMDLYNGDYGTDLSGSVTFDYGTGTFNCVAARFVWDLTNAITRIRYFLGPKRPQYEGDIQHWAGDVQIDDPDLDVAPFDEKQPTIEARSAAFEAIVGLLRRIDVKDANGDENALRDLFMHLWQSDMLVHLGARRLLSVTPEPGIAPSFGVGDIVGTNAVLRDTVSGPQRVYNMTVVQDPEGNQTISELQLSADQEV